MASRGAVRVHQGVRARKACVITVSVDFTTEQKDKKLKAADCAGNKYKVEKSSEMFHLIIGNNLQTLINSIFHYLLICCRSNCEKLLKLSVNMLPGI